MRVGMRVGRRVGSPHSNNGRTGAHEPTSPLPRGRTDRTHLACEWTRTQRRRRLPCVSATAADSQSSASKGVWESAVSASWGPRGPPPPID